MIGVDVELGPYWEVEIEGSKDLKCIPGGEVFTHGILQLYTKYLRIGRFKVPLRRWAEYQCFEHAEAFDDI